MARSRGLCVVALVGLSLAAAGMLPAQQGTQQAARQGPPVQGAEPDLALVERFDANRTKRLERAERDSARAYLAAHPELRQPMRGQRLPATGTPGPRIAPTDVPQYASTVGLYAPDAMRTIFLTFEHDDWEQELSAFWHTDVQVPATLEVDGRRYADVGISFRGNNSFHMVPDGLKRSFSISMDAWKKQDLLGHTSLNLLNSNQDPSFLRSVLYLDVARQYIPAPKANFVRVVVNGELWGVYVNQQTFSKALLKEQLGTDKGTRWKSPNNSLGGGFNYLGEDIAPYRRWYEMRGGDDTTAWRALATVTRVLTTTPPEQLEAALAPLMDVDETLKFLALDIALVNGDGYWNDGSDFNVLLDSKGRFQMLPHDVNEAFRARGNGAAPDPLVAIADTNKALRSRLLAVCQ
jgi:spore coat protein CotH